MLKIENFKMQLAVLCRAWFGRSSKKLEQDIDQLELLIGELETDEAERHAKRFAAADPAPLGPAQPRERRHPARKPLPAHLPREVVTHEPACTCPGCGSTKLSRIGQDEREVLEYVPSNLKVIRHVRPKLSCRPCETVMQMPTPPPPVERSLPGPGLFAHVLMSKVCNHTPLHRQNGIYAREGVELDRATLADWVGSAVFLRPLAEAIGRHIRAGVMLHADDTPVPALSPGWARPIRGGFGRSWPRFRRRSRWNASGGAGPRRAAWGYGAPRLHSTATRSIAGVCVPRCCSRAAGDSCTLTAMPGSAFH